MKQTILLPLCILLCATIHAQKPKVTWGEEFKIKRGSSDFEVVHADKTGIFVRESHVLKSGVPFASLVNSSKTSITLIKLDKNLTEVYQQSFNSELRNKDLKKVVFLKEKCSSLQVMSLTKALAFFSPRLTKTMVK